MGGSLPPDVWVALTAFLEQNNVNAGVYLRDQIRQAAHNAAITSCSTAPLMLADTLARYSEGTMSFATLLLVAILNREFCLQAIPEALARPNNDKKPSDFRGLQDFYIKCLRSPHVRGPVAEQLYLSVSSLLLLQGTGVDVVTALLSIFGGSAPSTVSETWCFLKLLSGMMSVLSDRRVPIGPVRRSSQRSCLQKNMHLILAPSLLEIVGESGEKDEDLSEKQAAIICQGVAFLTECNVCDAQETAPSFWAQLPLSPFWYGALKQLQQGTASETVVEAVCAVLRALTELDATAMTLLLQALEAVLHDGTCAKLAHVCRVVASAMESSVEEVVLRLNSDHALYRTLASGSDALQRVLAEPMLIVSPSLSEVAHVVCEGLSVLAQVFTLCSAPEMVETDDPEDYAMILDTTSRENQLKLDALLHMRYFFSECQALLLAWVRRLSVRDIKEVAVYVSQNNENVFAIQPDEVSVSLFLTYERVCRVLLLLPPPYGAPLIAIQALASEGFLTVAAWDAELSYRSLLSLDGVLMLHQQDVFLVPVVVHRFQRQWGPREREQVISSLTSLLCEAVTTLKCTESVAAISEALCELHAPAVPCMADALWQAIFLPCGTNEKPRRTIVSHLASFLEHGSAVLPSELLDDSSLDHRTLAELHSSMLSSLADVWRVMNYLQFMDPDEPQSHRVADRVAAWVQRAKTVTTVETSVGMVREAASTVNELGQYDSAVRQWCMSNPLHFRVAWRLLRHVDPERAAEILVSVLEAFVWRGTEEVAVNWSCESDCFAPYVIDTIAHSPYALRLQQVLSYVMQLSSRHVSDNNALHRLRAVVRGGNALLEGKRCPHSSILQIFCEAAKEYICLHQALSTTVPWDDTDKEELIADLARLATVTQHVAQLPLDAPPWLHAVRGAVDEFEIRQILRRGV